jgi:hypothetical protein
MSICDYCKKESKYLFICSHCGKRYCKLHRYPENHDCREIVTPEGEYIREDTPTSTNFPTNTEFIQSDNGALPETIFYEDFPSKSDAMDEERQDDSDDRSYEDTLEPPASNPPNNSDHTGIEWRKTIDQMNNIKTPLAIMIIISILTGALMGVLINPEDSRDNLQQRYDALYEYYSQIQTQNQILTQLNENLTIQISNIENELTQTKEDLSNLQSDWETVFSDEIQYQYPSTNQLKTWLALDETDQKTLNQEYTATQPAIHLSLMAKTQNWKLGAVTIYGNFTDTAQYTYNLVELEPGIMVYINPQTDRVWWTAYFEEITPNKQWVLEDYGVFVTRVDIILDP